MSRIVGVTFGLAALCLTAAPLGGIAQARGPQSVAPVAGKLLTSVVNISTSQKMKGGRKVPLPRLPQGSPFDKFFDDFFKRRGRSGGPRRVSSLGSGFVIDPSGLIVTNNHVIDGADEITVNFSDGSKLIVDKVLGKDPKTDLALLKVTPKKPLKAVKWGDSSVMRVGDWVMAIGNPFGLGGSLSVGVISAKKRDINSGPYDEFIQTDAAINKGNSGGPLFNMDGDVIGVNTAIISPSGGSIGIGFAVPANTARYVIGQLEKFGKTRRGYLGARVQTISDEIAQSLGLDRGRGALVAAVTPGSPASKGGLKVGDVITKFNDNDVPSMRALPRIVARTPIETDVPVVVLRDGKVENLKIRIGQLTEKDDGKKKKTAAAPGDEDGTEEDQTDIVMGMALTPLTDDLRRQYGFEKSTASVKGVVVLEVDPDSDAAKKGIVEGNVITEVTQVSVATPQDVSKRIEALQASGRQSALLLVVDNKGELRFVAVGFEKAKP